MWAVVHSSREYKQTLESPWDWIGKNDLINDLMDFSQTNYDYTIIYVANIHYSSTLPLHTLNKFLMIPQKERLKTKKKKIYTTRDLTTNNTRNPSRCQNYSIFIQLDVEFTSKIIDNKCIQLLSIQIVALLEFFFFSQITIRFKLN